MMGKALRWSEGQLADHLRRVPANVVAQHLPDANPIPVAVCQFRHPEHDPSMNKTEAEYAGLLEDRRRRGEIAAWKYESITLKLADNTRYTPDFLVILVDGTLEFHETKGGFIREDGWLKLKIAAGMFPFRFFLCQKAAKKEGGEWSIRKV